MENLNLSDTILNVIRKLDYISLDSDNEEQKNIIAECRNQLFKFFPQSQMSYKYKGKIEDIIIEMNEKYSNRIIDHDEKFGITMDVFCPKESELFFGDIHLLNDCIKLHFPECSFKLSVFNSEAIDTDELLLLVNFVDKIEDDDEY
ncbi:MAG: hypothetical protein KIG88_09930 [Weeksellaceae bacterium]|nr:hypothetical protein [Weeksellaceae bacterium]